MDSGNLSRREIFSIACDVIDGTAEKVDAESLLALFCEYVDKEKAIPRDLAVHLRDAFRRYLTGEKTIEAALGLVKNKHRPKGDQDLPIKMATEVLRLRMRKTNHNGAVANVMGKFKCGKTTVEDAWKKHQLAAILTIRMERHLDKFPWTSREMEMLDSIFAGKSWYIGTPDK